MEKFDQIGIENLSRKDFFMILQALEYTGEQTGIHAFTDLKEELIQQLTDLSEITEEEFMNMMQS